MAGEIEALQRTVRPCPYCAGSAKLGPMSGTTGWWRVRCEWHHCGGTTWAMQSTEEAVAAWNRRPSDGQT